MKQAILITIRVEQVPARLRPYLSNRMVLEGDTLVTNYIIYKIQCVYIYIYAYTVYKYIQYIIEICREREREAATYTIIQSVQGTSGKCFFLPSAIKMLSNESFITQSLAPMVTASTQLISTVTVHVRVLPKSRSIPRWTTTNGS